MIFQIIATSHDFTQHHAVSSGNPPEMALNLRELQAN